MEHKRCVWIGTRDESKKQILFLICLFGIASSDVALNTKSGPVKGTTGLSEDVTAFLGIPFAEPPVNELRFAKPIPKTPWTAVYNATNLPPPCMQYAIEPNYYMPDVTNMSEDCLYLNLWVPKSKNISGLRPVVIFIHGGLFSIGTGSFNVYDGSRLASRGDLIVATFNYRLGAFGFLLAHTEDAPGNMGMHDQIMAIRWIKDNAEVFGGDPHNIVLMGESAGALSIAIHMVSPLSENLFKRAIIESGISVHSYVLDENARLDRNSQSVASLAGCANETVSLKVDPRSVVECLKSKPKEAIVEAEKAIVKSMPFTFFPSMDDDLLPKSSVDRFREGKFRKDVDVLIGTNRDEGSMMLTFKFPEFFGHYGREVVGTMSKRRATMFSRAIIAMVKQPNASEIIDFYVKRVDNHDSSGYTKMLSDFVGDFMVTCGTLFLADFLSLKGNAVYFYKFEFRAASTPMAEWIGVTHFDELQYVFGNPFHDNFTSEEIEFSNLLMDRWSAFARTGNPNIPGEIPWPQYSYHNRLYMNIGQEEETIRMDPDRRCEFWRKTFRSEIDPSLIRFLENSGTNETSGFMA